MRVVAARYATYISRVRPPVVLFGRPDRFKLFRRTTLSERAGAVRGKKRRATVVDERIRLRDDYRRMHFSDRKRYENITCSWFCRRVFLTAARVSSRLSIRTAWTFIIFARHTSGKRVHSVRTVCRRSPAPRRSLRVRSIWTLRLFIHCSNSPFWFCSYHRKKQNKTIYAMTRTQILYETPSAAVAKTFLKRCYFSFTADKTLRPTYVASRFAPVRARTAIEKKPVVQA